MDRGQFTVGDGWARYRGPAVEGSFHRHAAFQIVVTPPEVTPTGQAQDQHESSAILRTTAEIAGDGEAASSVRPADSGDIRAARPGTPVVPCARYSHGGVAMIDESGAEHRGTALVVPPMVRHRLVPAPDVLTFYIEPHSALADELRERFHDGIVAAPALRDLHDIGEGRSHTLDPRLQHAMRLLRERNLPMPRLAAEVGLSPQRLRALARSQIGMPLPRWRVWSELRRAAEALRAGQSPSEAAITAGFADQAHLTRRMREMVGLTPAAVLPVLRNHLHPTPQAQTSGEQCRSRSTR